jgi:hypothetical protein
MHDVYRIVENEIIRGKSISAFIHNGGTFFPTQVEVYQDGKIKCWGLLTLEEFKQQVRNRWIITTLPEGAWVSIDLLTKFRATDVYNNVEEIDLIKEVEDIIEQLNDHPSLSQICLRAFLRFLEDPTDGNREQLQAAYTAVPEHLKMFILGDQDAKDGPIRAILANNVDEEGLQWMRREYIRP